MFQMVKLKEIIESHFMEIRAPKNFVNWIASAHPFNHVLESYYSGYKDYALHELSDTLISAFDIVDTDLTGMEHTHRPKLYTTQKQLMNYLEWDLENFRSFGERKTGGYAYLHQLEIAAILAFYIRKYDLSINAEERKILLFSSLGHDTLEEPFFDNKTRSYSYGEFESNLKNLLRDDISVRIFQAIAAVTRRTKKGTELNYRDSTNRILTSSGEIREYSVLVKLADRLQNVRTLKEVTRKSELKDLAWNLKNIYKSVVLAENVRKYYRNKSSRFKPVIDSMIDDIIASSNSELHKLSDIFMNRATMFNDKHDVFLEVLYPVRDPPVSIDINKMDINAVKTFGYPDHFVLYETERSVEDYFLLMDNMLDAWMHKTNSRKRTGKISVSQLAYDIIKARSKKQREAKTGSPFREYEAFLDDILDEKHRKGTQRNKAKKMNPQWFYNGMLKDWGLAYYVANLMIYCREPDKTDYPVGLLELALDAKNKRLSQILKKSDSGNLYEKLTQRNKNIVDNLFYYSLSGYMMKGMQGL